MNGKRSARKVYGITLEMAQKHLEEWMEAELEITTHQSYRLGNETLTMADLDAVRRNIDYWNAKVEELLRKQNSTRRNRFYRAVPNDG